MANPLLDFAASAYAAITDIAAYVGNALLGDRTFGDDPILPPPNPQIPPYTPPFSGGQCLVSYRVTYRLFRTDVNGNELGAPDTNTREVVASGRILRISVLLGNLTASGGYDSVTWNLDRSSGVTGLRNQAGSSGTGIYGARGEIVSVVRVDGLPDNCGNLPNPNAPIPSNVGGGSLVPVVDSPIEVYGGIPIPSFAALLAALKTIADGIAAIGNVLDGVRQIGDAINKIREILDDFLNRWNDKEKENPQKRKVSVGAWREMAVDGGFGTGKFSAQNVEYSPYQLQIEIQSFPSTVSRRLGVNSPTYAHLEPIGWIFLRSANGGYSEPVPIRYLRNSISLAEDTNGVSYSFRENPLAKAKCRVWYSSAPSITGNI